MKCMSCEVYINPKWKHAISMNVCPSCGESLLPDEVKTLVSDVYRIFDEFNKAGHQESLIDLLSSNFNFISRDSSEYQDLTKNQKSNHEPDPTPIKIRNPDGSADSTPPREGKLINKTDDSRASMYMKRAGTDPAKIRAMISEIKNSSTQSSVITEDMIEMMAGEDENLQSAFEADPEEQEISRIAQANQRVPKNQADVYAQIEERKQSALQKLKSGTGSFSSGS